MPCLGKHQPLSGLVCFSSQHHVPGCGWSGAVRLVGDDRIHVRPFLGIIRFTYCYSIYVAAGKYLVLQFIFSCNEPRFSPVILFSLPRKSCCHHKIKCYLSFDLPSFSFYHDSVLRQLILLLDFFVLLVISLSIGSSIANTVEPLLVFNFRYIFSSMLPFGSYQSFVNDVRCHWIHTLVAPCCCRTY